MPLQPSHLQPPNGADGRTVPFPTAYYGSIIPFSVLRSPAGAAISETIQRAGTTGEDPDYGSILALARY